MQDPFEPTPMPFHNRVEQKLSELQRKEKPAVRSYRLVVVGAVTLALLCGTALALEHLGVLHFLTERIWQGDPVDAAAIVQPTQQQCDSELLDATVPGRLLGRRNAFHLPARRSQGRLRFLY